MKPLKLFLALLMTTSILAFSVGCNKDSDSSKEPPKVHQPTQISISELTNYKKIYKEEVDRLISEFGKFDDSESGTAIKGLKYGSLVDFDNDKIPEMIVSYNQRVLLYKIIDNKAVCLYDEPVETTYKKMDLSRIILVNSTTETPSLIVSKTTKPTMEERIQIITLNDGKVVIDNLYGKIADGIDPPMPSESKLVQFYWNDKEISEEEYNKLHSTFINKDNYIELCWDIEPATKSSLEDFIISLQ